MDAGYGKVPVGTTSSREQCRFKLISGPGCKRSIGSLGTGRSMGPWVLAQSTQWLNRHWHTRHVPRVQKIWEPTRGLLATDHVILNHGQVTWTTPELAPPLLTTTPHQREDVSALDRFNVHRCPTQRVFSGTGIELMTCLPWLDTLTTGLPQPHLQVEVWRERNHSGMILVT
ncbi:uncharacterized protein TNCV_2802351 [Trichonephila clavipes]|nr:uncharacterized protein TNCV_2802351 [Trichonephila clavipes]